VKEVGVAMLAVGVVGVSESMLERYEVAAKSEPMARTVKGESTSAAELEVEAGSLFTIKLYPDSISVRSTPLEEQGLADCQTGLPEQSTCRGREEKPASWSLIIITSPHPLQRSFQLPVVSYRSQICQSVEDDLVLMIGSVSPELWQCRYPGS
jgi:hypothetical protein